MSKIRALRATSGEVRTGVFNSRKYVIVPVVALVEGVIQASNSIYPELVLAEEFRKSSQGWDGRPVMIDHPEVEGEKTSANSPAILEKYQIGYVFNSRSAANKLSMEAWIDEERCREIAPATLDRILASETIDVSVGVFVQMDETAGQFDGVSYSNVWREIIPDHLAFLPEGMSGACSLQMGCGAQRAASGGAMKVFSNNMRLALAKAIFAEGLSSSALHMALSNALSAELGFQYVVDVFPDDHTVVYTCQKDSEEPYLFRRSYSVNADGSVIIGDDKTEVKQKPTEYVPVSGDETTSAPMPAPIAASTCGCNKEGGKDMTKKERVAALIASGKTPYKTEHAAFLEGAPDDVLKALEENSTATVATEPEPKPEPEPEKPPTEDEYLAKAPETIKQIVSEHKAASAAKRAKLIASLKTAQSVYSEAELGKLDTEHLEKLEAMAAELKPAKVDFSAASANRAASGDDRPASSEELRAAQSAKFGRKTA